MMDVLMPRAERLWIPAGFLVLIYGSLRPVADPDLFMHLCAGRRFLSGGGLPGAEFLSYTRLGTPWPNPEWLTQILYAWTAAKWGWAGLIALKTLVLAAAALCLERTLRLWQSPPAARGAVLALFAAGMAATNDVRPDNFSVLLFSAEILALELLEAESRPRPGAAAAAAAGVFMLWANLHGGFVLGLALAASHFLDACRRGRAAARRHGALTAAAALGTFGTPFGWRVHQSILFHARHSIEFQRHNIEMARTDFGNPYNWSFWLLLVLAIGAAAFRHVNHRLRGAHWLALSGLALAAIWHRRLIPFFVLAALAYLPRALQGMSWGVARRGGLNLSSASCLLAATAFLRFCAPMPIPFAALKAAAFPEGTADFLVRQEKILSPLRMYNPWGWGGYLAYRLYPRYRVFAHGLYLFFDLVEEEARSTDRPEHWQAFLNRRRVDFAILKRNLPDVRMGRVLPDGSAEYEPRPYYLFFMPQDRWALVYWDEVSLVFARADSVARPWLRKHEYHWLHPGDVEALRRALTKGRFKKEDLLGEICRHEAESGRDPESDLLGIPKQRGCFPEGLFRVPRADPPPTEGPKSS